MLKQLNVFGHIIKIKVLISFKYLHWDIPTKNEGEVIRPTEKSGELFSSQLLALIPLSFLSALIPLVYYIINQGGGMGWVCVGCGGEWWCYGMLWSRFRSQLLVPRFFVGLNVQNEIRPCNPPKNRVGLWIFDLNDYGYSYIWHYKPC